jgi:hypothetical protein
MADFFSNLAGQVLGIGAQVGPLLPPRFAPWPELPASGALPHPPAPVDAPASVDAAAFPPPLIAPDHPAIDTPLPTLRQMSQLRSQPGPPVEAAVPPALPGSPETTDAAHTAPPRPPASRRRAAPLPGPPTSTPAVPHPGPMSATANEAPPAAPAVQKDGGGGVTDETATVRSVPAPATDSRPAAGATTAEAGKPPATPSRTAPVSALRSERPAEPPPAAGPTQPVRVQAEGAAPLKAVGDQATTVRGSQPTHLPVTPADQEGSPEPPPIQSTAPGPKEVIQRQAPAKGVEAPPPSTAASPARTAPDVHPRPQELIVPPTLVSSEAPVKALDQPPTTPAVGSQMTPHVLTSPDHATTLGLHDEPAVHRQRAEAHPSGDVPIMPSMTPSSPASGRGSHVPPEVTTSVSATMPEATAPPDKLTAPAERHAPSQTQLEAPDDEGALTGSREPTILPAPEPAPEQVWSIESTTQAEAGVSLRQAPARPTAGAPEPAPTVRVTIGRVVVRASPADERPPARRVELPRPPLSLEEYLQGRQGGGR